MKKVLLIVSGYKKGANDLAVKISEYLSSKDFEPLVYKYDGYNGLRFDDAIFENDFSFIVSLGGDGNVLFASRFASPKHIPVVPINFGQFGFIANIEPADWRQALDEFLAGNQESHERMLLEVKVLRNETSVATYHALNEAVVAGYGAIKLLTVDLFYNNYSLGNFRADGVIVSTPTGSTGYAVAAGGPILDPTMSAFVVSPIAPFTLSNRPIVLPTQGSVCIKVLPQRQKKLILSIDGQEAMRLEANDAVVVTRAENTVNLVGCSQAYFYKVLRAKLGWSGSLQDFNAKNSEVKNDCKFNGQKHCFD